MTKILPLFLLLLLVASLSASLTYTANQTATYKVGASTIATVQLLNTLIYPNGVSTLGKSSIDGTPGCGPDLKTAKVCLAVTPSVTRTLTASSKITAKVSNSLKGTIGGAGFTIYEARNTTYQNAIISQAPSGQLDTNGTGIMTSFISGYFNTTIERTAWYPLQLDNYTIQAGKKYIIGLDYVRTDTSDVGDLVPGIFTDDATAWAYWNTSWPVNLNCTVNASTADNMTFLARCTFTGLNSTTINQTTCTDPRFLVTGVDTAPRPYILSSNFSTYCGIGNATYFIPVNGSRGTTINIEGYFGNTGATSGENGPAVCSLMNISNMYIANFDENTTARDRCGVHNLTRSNTGCTVQNTKGFYPGFTYNLTGNCNWNKTVGTGLSGVCNGNMACYEYALIHLNGAGYSSQGPWQIGAPNLNYRLVYFQTAAQTTDNYASVNNAFAWAPDSNIGWNSIMDNYDQTNMYFSVANLSSNRTGSAAAAPAPATNNSFISIGNSGGVIAYYAGYIQMVIYGTSNYSRSFVVGQHNQTSVVTSALALPQGTGALSYTNSTVAHSFLMNASSTRTPGLKNYSLNSSLGTCVQLSNSTFSGASWVYFNCSGPALQATSIQYNYTLTDGVSFAMTGGNTYPNNAPMGIQVPAPNGTGVNFTCAPNATTNTSIDPDGDTVSYYWWESTDNTTWSSISNSTNNWAVGFAGNLTNGSIVQFRVAATDTYTNTTNQTTLGNTLIHIASLESSTNPEYTMYSYTHVAILNISSCLVGDAIININGANSTPTKTATSTGYNFTTTAAPPQTVQNSSSAFNVTWYYNTSIVNYTRLNTISLYPSGIMQCGVLTNTTAMNVTTKDAVSLSAITTNYSTTLTTAYNSVGFTGTANFYGVCVLPTNESFNTTIQESFTASGYSALTQTRSATLNNITSNYTYYLVPSNVSTSTKLTVTYATSIPVVGATINVYQYTAPNYYSLLTCTTDAGGACLVSLQPNSVFYKYNITSGGSVTTVGPEVLSCTVGASTCYRNFVIGPGTFLGCQWTGAYTGACTYNTSTTTLTCIGGDTGRCLNSTTLSVYRAGNYTSICNQTLAGYSNTMQCVFPAVNGTYIFTFYGTNQSQNVILSSGQITVNPNTTSTFGRSGWLAALILFLFMAMVGYYNLGLSIVLGVFSIGISVVMQILPMEVTTIFVLLGVAGGAILYRMKL